MPQVTKQSAAEFQDAGVVQVWQDEVDGYQISFLDVQEDADMAPLLKGLPNDQCPCPHWGYVVKGNISFNFGDHTETYEAGAGFYAPPGHTPASTAGSEILFFSPAELGREVDAQIAKNVAALQGT